MHRKIATKFLILSIFVMIALSLNYVSAKERLADKRYVDPKGYFKIVPPTGWRMQEYPQDLRGKVAFSAPDESTDLRILVNSVEFSTVEELKAWCKDLEKQLGTDTHIKQTTFSGRPAIERSLEMRGLKLYYIDFLIGKVDHNLAFSAPVRLYEKYRPIALTSIETYEPLTKELTDDQARQHLVAKMRRLAQLMIENGNLHLALEYIAEGLQVAPDDAVLLELKKQIDARGTAKQSWTPTTTSVSQNSTKRDEKPSNADTPAQGTPAQQQSKVSDEGGILSILGPLFAVAMFLLFFRRLFGFGKKK
jgi:hypothetical protein